MIVLFIAVITLGTVFGAVYFSTKGSLILPLPIPGIIGCPSDAKPFQNTPMSYHTVFELPHPPSQATICFTVQVSGQLPLGGLHLAPELLQYSTSRSGSMSSECANVGTNCGGVSVSAAPMYVYFPLQAVHVIVTIVTMSNSTSGLYWLWFWACSGGGIVWLRIPTLNQTLQTLQGPASACIRTDFHVSLTFNSYSGLIPLDENITNPILL